VASSAMAVPALMLNANPTVRVLFMKRVLLPCC
jgi:hypothetical protein